MEISFITTLKTLQNQLINTCPWRRETILTQTKQSYRLFAHFYFPILNKNLPAELTPFWLDWCQKHQPPADCLIAPTGLFLNLSFLGKMPFPNTAFLIFDLADVLTHDTLFQKYLKQKPPAQKIVLTVSDTALLALTDKEHLTFDFLYLPSQKAISFLPEKNIFHVQTAEDYRLLPAAKTIHIGGTFIETFLSQKRYQKCPFSKECTSQACTTISSHSAHFLKCADPTFLTHHLTELSHEIR